MRLLVLLPSLLLVGCTLPGPAPAPGPGATHAVEWELRPGGTRELDLALEEAARIAYALSASAPVGWDLHSHGADGAVVIHASGEEPEASGEFVAPAAGVYSLYVQARGAAVTVSVEVAGAFRVVR